MRSFRRLLLESFENELNEANRYFIGSVSENDGFDDEFLYVLKDRYSIDDITDLLVGHFPKMLQRKDILDIASTFFDNRYANVMANEGNSLAYIPVFKFLFDNKSYDFNDFCQLYMSMHLTKDKLAAYENGFTLDSENRFEFDIVDKIDSMLNSPEYYIGINTVLEILNYIDYENKVNDCENNREYLDALNGITDKLHNYLSFWATSKDIARFEEAKASSSKCKIVESYDNLHLVRFVLGRALCTKNSVIQIDEIEAMLQNGDESQMKKNLIAAFAYKKYDSTDSFFDAFSNVSLTVSDLNSFIRDYEKTGRVLSADQFGNILTNFRRSFLAREDEDVLNNTVKEAYKQFRKDNYTSSDLEFIEKFALETGVSFNRCDFERIINGNYLYDFDDLILSKSFKNYCKVTGYSTESDEVALKRYADEAQRREEIYNKYYDNLFLHQDSVDETIEYFIRNNVSKEDVKDFNKMKTWFENSTQFTGWNMGDEVKARCAIKLLDNFTEELENSPFMERQVIYNKYLKYAINDGIRKFAAPKDFTRALESYEVRFKSENAWALLGEVCTAYDNKDSLADRIFDLGLTVDDALEMFSILENRADPEFKAVIKKVSAKLNEDELAREEESKAVKMRETDKLYRDMVRDFLSTDGMTVKTYCKLNNIVPTKMQIAISYCREHDKELAEEYLKRSQLIRSGYYNIDKMPDSTVRAIANGIVSGIERKDGSRREFNYLDYRLMTDLPIGVFVTSILNTPGYRYSKEDVDKIREFTLLHARPVYYKEKNILKTREEISINGVSQEVSEATKQAAFNYIDSLELPHEMKLYKIVVRGIVDGSLKVENSIDSSKQSVKVFEK